MNIVDLLVTIVVVTILVTIILAVVTYVAYKLRLSREPQRMDEDSGPQYFIRYEPTAAVDARRAAIEAVIEEAGAPETDGLGAEDTAAEPEPVHAPKA